MRLVKIELYVTAASGVANIILNFLLIPALGIEGAAMASAASFALSALLLNHYAAKLLGYANPPEAFKLMAAALMAFLLVLLAKPLVSDAASWITDSAGAGDFLPKAVYLAYLGFLISLSGALFIAIALALKCFCSEDVALMARVMERAGLPGPLVSMAEKVASYGVGGKI
jgi:O-antigen/teichoic acid export membrane protein